MAEMGKWFSLVTLYIIGSFGFSFQFRALESTYVSGSSNIGEVRLRVSRHNKIFNMGGPSRIVATLFVLFPFRSVQPLPLKRIRDAAASARPHKSLPSKYLP